MHFHATRGSRYAARFVLRFIRYRLLGTTEVCCRERYLVDRIEWRQVREQLLTKLVVIRGRLIPAFVQCPGRLRSVHRAYIHASNTHQEL